jgi:hemerythrin-like domain-containing protein
MSGSQTFQRITRQTIDEHRQIHFYLDQVSLTLKSLGSGTEVEPLRRLAAQIEGLKERLLEHHHAEEKGGLFQAILEAMPDCRVEVSRLTLQHDKMIEVLEMARIHAQCGGVTEGTSLRTDLEGFLEMFRRHEQDEEQLLKLAMTREGRSLGD